MAEKRPRGDDGMAAAAASNAAAPAAAAAAAPAAAAAAATPAGVAAAAAAAPAAGGGAAVGGGSTSAATFAAASDASSFSQASLDGVLAVIRRLRVEAGANENFVEALSTIRKMLSNILHHPTEEKFRSVRIGNKHFYAQVGRFTAGIELLQCFGFEEAVRNAADGTVSGHVAAAAPASSAVAAAPTHLALPVADPAKMAPGLVLLEAARQASAMVTAAGDTADGACAAAAAAPTDAAAAPAAADATSDNVSMEREMKRSRSERSASSDAAVASRATGGGAATAAAAAAVQEAPQEEHDGDDSFILPPDLEDYSAAGIDQYFGTVLKFDEGTSGGLSLGELTLRQLVATAEDASSIAQATADTTALSRAQHWLQILKDFQATDGREVTDAGGAAGGAALAVAGASTAAASAGNSENALNPGGDGIGWDGNYEACASCGVEGELVCCDSCPRAYHMTTECLGGPDAMPPVRLLYVVVAAVNYDNGYWFLSRVLTLIVHACQEDDDAQWICPACTMETQLAAKVW
jgi:hypothetical protein